MDRSSVSVEEVTSAAMTHRAGEIFNPPGLTNFLGCAQAARDVLAIQHLTFPPYSLGDAVIGRVTIDDHCVATSGIPVTYTWRPDRIVREARIGDLKIATRAVLGVGSRSACLSLALTNGSGARRNLRLKIRTGDGVIRSDSGWKTPYSPRERGSISVTPWEGTPPADREVINRRDLLRDGEGIVYASRTSRAFCLQATSVRPKTIEGQDLILQAELGPGEEKRWSLLVAVGPDPDALVKDFDAWRRDPEVSFTRAEQEWNLELAAAFTPGNDRYSGHLPRLQTTNPDLRKIYLSSVLGTIYFKRESPDIPGGRTYSTLMPRYWVTTSFINDWSLDAWALTLLDPACLRRHVELWLGRDINRHFGSEYVSGSNAGNWYSCNDYAMIRLIGSYLRMTGDFRWLESKIEGLTLADHVKRIALHYKELDRGHGLADYGDRNSLLECVGSYVHEVASLNAAAVWTLREAADIFARTGDRATADDFRRQASGLVPRIRELYVEGKGYWNCRRPDGALTPVRHAWDFVHALNFLHADLPRGQVDEMVAFFQEELQTPSWMHALSPLDGDVDFSLRPDHQWNGSYPAWPALAAGALRKAGRMDLLVRWLPGLARSANQGPYSQSHFVESYADPEDGGARKAPTEWPYINDWAALAGGAFFETVLGAIFGVDPGFEAIAARPALAGIDEAATLEGLRYRGRLYRVDSGGIR